VAAILDRIAADIDELVRARRVDDLATAAVLPGRHAETPPTPRTATTRSSTISCLTSTITLVCGW
jgi:hypothetical protein